MCLLFQCMSIFCKYVYILFNKYMNAHIIYMIYVSIEKQKNMTMHILYNYIYYII